MYKVLITTSGTGSRLGELTKNTNKSLIKIGGKAAISYIVEAYPREVAFVVTLGYFGDQVSEFLKNKYPDRFFEFVKVSPYEGQGSSLGYSMYCAKDNLQCPFVFHACDTIVLETIPSPDRNWLGGYIPNPEDLGLDTSKYRTHKIKDGKIIRVNDKGVTDFGSIHIGISGINDFDDFWKLLGEILGERKNDQSISDVHVIESMLHEGKEFKLVPFKTWLDIGNPEALNRANKYFTNAITH